jgi:hypothetical protein
MRKLAAIALMYLSCIYGALASGGYMGAGQVAYMQSAYGGWLIFMSGIPNPNPNPDGCSNNWGIFLDPGAPQYKEHLALLMSAQIAKTPINIYVAGCHGAGYKLLYFVLSGSG